MFAEFGKQMATRATTTIVNFVVARFDPKLERVSESVMAMETVQKAMAEVGQTSRHAIDAVVRMAEQQRPAVRELVIPIGFSCETMRIGDPANGAITIDRTLRAAIDSREDVEVQTARHHEIMISEMDRLNQSCKFAFRSDEDSERRVTGEITDPVIQAPSNPYSSAFSEQRWITVVGKLQVKAGEADKLFISDIIP
jgi:hypothetical protein